VPLTSCRGWGRGLSPIQGIGGFPGSLNRRWFLIFTFGSPRGSSGGYLQPRGISSVSRPVIRGYPDWSPNLPRAGDPGGGSFLSRGRGLIRFREDPRGLFLESFGSVPKNDPSGSHPETGDDLRRSIGSVPRD
jgi:hypothetical protein